MITIEDFDKVQICAGTVTSVSINKKARKPAYNILMISYWQSMQNTKSALAVSLSLSIVWPAVLTSLLPLAFGNEVIWLCHSLSEGITACTAFVLLAREKSKDTPTALPKV